MANNINFHIIAITVTMCLFPLFVRGELPPAPSSLSSNIKFKLYTGLEFGRRAITLFAPASDYLDSLNTDLRLSDIREVYNTLQSLATLLQYQRLLNSSMAAESEVAVATNAILQAVVNDACSWLMSILGSDSFNCMEADIKSLTSHIEVYQSMMKSASAFRRVCTDDCARAPLFTQWVLESIPCEGDGVITREYLASPTTVVPALGPNDDFSCLRCASASSGATVAPTSA